MDGEAVLKLLLAAGEKLGRVKSAHLYESGLATVEGERGGARFCLSCQWGEAPNG